MLMEFIDQEIAIAIAKYEVKFHKTILNTLPAILYINRLDRPGDIISIKNTWMNQRGLDFFCIMQTELSDMGYNFFREIIHPTDLELQAVSLKTVYTDESSGFFVPMLRVKPKGRTDYSLFCCSKVVMDTFPDGTLKKELVIAMQITPPNNQPVSEWQVHHLLNCEHKLRNLTHRETEILHLIVKGKTNNDIAKDLSISIATAKKHRTNLIQKTGVKNSAELAALAVESGEY